jgi:hypothetical protein
MIGTLGYGSHESLAGCQASSRSCLASGAPVPTATNSALNYRARTRVFGNLPTLTTGRISALGPSGNCASGVVVRGCESVAAITRSDVFADASTRVQWTGPLPMGAAPEITTFNWIIDDIVSWTGETQMCSPGGGGVQTAFGARLAGCACRLCCRVGDDFPDSHREYLEMMGVSLVLVSVPGWSRASITKPCHPREIV